MSRDSDWGLMLDPGVTALTLRALHRHDGHYPFLDRFRRRWRLESHHRPSGRPARRKIRWAEHHRLRHAWDEAGSESFTPVFYGKLTTGAAWRGRSGA